MKRAIKYVVIIAAAILVAFIVLYFNNDIGMPLENVEKNARASQAIPEDWQTAKETMNAVSAMIFYSGSLDDSTYAIYVKRPVLSFGYFFRAGGSASEIERGVAEFRIEGYEERAFISMNRQKVNMIEIDDGNGIETIDVDSEKPFVYILPIDIGSVTFYNVSGNVIECIEREL